MVEKFSNFDFFFFQKKQNYKKKFQPFDINVKSLFCYNENEKQKIFSLSRSSSYSICLFFCFIYIILAISVCRCVNALFVCLFPFLFPFLMPSAFHLSFFSRDTIAQYTIQRECITKRVHECIAKKKEKKTEIYLNR